MLHNGVIRVHPVLHPAIVRKEENTNYHNNSFLQIPGLQSQRGGAIVELDMFSEVRADAIHHSQHVN